MGFSEEQSRSALVRFNNNIDEAMNFLLSGGISENVESPSRRPQIIEVGSTSHVSEDYINLLSEMGFDRMDASQALRMSGNDYERACEYLLNSDARQEAADLYQGEEPINEDFQYEEDLFESEEALPDEALMEPESSSTSSMYQDGGDPWHVCLNDYLLRFTLYYLIEIIC